MIQDEDLKAAEYIGNRFSSSIIYYEFTHKMDFVSYKKLYNPVQSIKTIYNYLQHSFIKSFV